MKRSQIIAAFGSAALWLLAGVILVCSKGNVIAGICFFFLGALWLGKAIYMLRQNRRNYNKTEIEVEKNG